MSKNSSSVVEAGISAGMLAARPPSQPTATGEPGSTVKFLNYTGLPRARQEYLTALSSFV